MNHETDGQPIGFMIQNQRMLSEWWLDYETKKDAQLVQFKGEFIIMF